MANNKSFEISSEWVQWLLEQEEKALASYQLRPKKLIADYYGERKIVRDYQGREILELLQNANDAAAEKGIAGRVAIRLLKDGLIIANTGRLFTSEGVESLCIADLSPKRFNKRNLIGQKGLGFRAILNWSHHPIIISGSLSLTYSLNKIRQVYEKILLHYPAIKEALDAENTDQTDIILPLLTFPAFLDQSNANDLLNTEASRNIYENCLLLKQDGFDTVIGMPFYNNSIFGDAKKDIDELQPETLLFTKNLSEIQIGILNDEKLWKVNVAERKGTHDVIAISKKEDDKTALWNVYRMSSSLPASLLDAASDVNLEYEIVLAFPSRINDQSKIFPLFCYFSTEVVFPFPVICHATLDLEANRKHPQSSKANEFIFKKIAAFLAETVERLDSADDKWNRCRVVARIKDYDQLLVKVGFERELIAQIKKRSVIPTKAESYISPAGAKTIKAEDLSWLPKINFEDVALPTNNEAIRRLLKELDIPKLEGQELCNRINALKFDDVETRARVIAGLINNSLLSDTTPEIMIEESGSVIRTGKRIYLPPIESLKKYDLPSWLNIAFLGSELRNSLMAHLKTQDQRDLRQKLVLFGVNEYSLASVAGAVISEAKRRVDSESDKATDYIKEALIALLLMFPDEEPPVLPEAIGALLPNRQNGFSTSRQLYFSQGYSANGDLLNALYAKCAPNRLLASPDEIGLDGTDPNNIRFLKWLGIADLPREIKTDKIDSGYVDYLLDSLPYPVKLEDYSYEKRGDFYYPSIQEVRTIDHLDGILDSDSGAVLTWLAIDERAPRWRLFDTSNATLKDKPYRAQYYRVYGGSLPSYIRWKIQNTSWLPISETKKEKPCRVMYGERALEKIMPPPAEFDHPLFKLYGIDRLRLRSAWDNCGVLPNFSYLQPDQIIEILIALPSIDSDGKSARTIYRNILEQVNVEQQNWQESSSKFKQKGLMWGTGPEGTKYYSVKELRHADTDDIPDVLSSKIKLVDIPKRQGAIKVQKVFGVDPIDNRKITIDLKRIEESVHSKDIQALFHRAKPFLFAIRQVKTRQLAEINMFKKLNIILCKTIELSLSYEKLTIDLSFTDPYQWIIRDDTAYILEDQNERATFQSDIFADTIGAILATTFRLDSGGDFARMLRCNERDRQVLLKRILGDSMLLDISDLKKEFDEVGNLPGFIYRSNDPRGNGIVNTPGTESKPDREQVEDEHPSTFPGNETGLSPGQASVTKASHEPTTSEKRSIVIRTKTTMGPDVTLQTTRKVTDGNLCEDHVLLFERYEGRWPLKVSGIQGYQGARCDVISFKSEAGLNEFVAASAQNSIDVSQVDRFIEVKGRSSERGTVPLKGNELTAAQVYAERYYLYRLYERQKDDYILLILNNPLNHKEAVEPIQEVDLMRAQAAEKYYISFGNTI